MAKNKTVGGEKWCGQCKQWLPVSQFLKVPKPFRVTGCNACARENMRKYSMTNMVGKMPEDFNLSE